MKKKEKMHEIEQFREKEKERWKSFTHKVVLDPQPTDLYSLSLIIPTVFQVSRWPNQFKAKEEYICCSRLSGRKGQSDAAISTNDTSNINVCSPLMCRLA